MPHLQRRAVAEPEDSVINRMQSGQRSGSGQVSERLELPQSASTAHAVGRTAELENPLGVIPWPFG